MTAFRIFPVFLALAACGVAACGDGGTDVPRATMRFSTPPSPAVAGQTFAVSVELLDASGVRSASADTVTITTEDGTPVGGTTVVAASAGVASFTGLSITKANASARLKASSRSRSATSNSFAISAAPPTSETSSVTPTMLATGLARHLTLTFADAFGNRVASRPVSVTPNLAGATLSPNAGTTTPAGTFATVLTATTEGFVGLTATLAGAQVAFAPVIVQAPCTATTISFPGSVSSTLPSETCLVAGVSALPYRFATTTTGAVLFSLASGFPSALDVTTDPPTESVVLRGGTTQSGEWLLPAGTYQVRVGATGGAGDFTLTSTSVPGNQGQVIRNILVGGAYAQSLGTGDFMFPEIFGDNSFWDVFRIRSGGACTITARATGSTGLDLLLLAVDSANVPITLDDNSAGGIDPRLTLSPCQVGGQPIRVLVNHYLETAGGPYTLTVSFTPGASATPPLMSWDSVRSQLRPGKRGGRVTPSR